jgi:hypothetical protein
MRGVLPTALSKLAGNGGAIGLLCVKVEFFVDGKVMLSTPLFDKESRLALSKANVKA